MAKLLILVFPAAEQVQDSVLPAVEAEVYLS